MGETFKPRTDHGGHDGHNGEERGLGYLEWTHDLDPSDIYTVDYAYRLRQGEQVWVEHDRHIEGLFARANWLGWLEQTGFQASSVVDAYERDLFIGLRPR